MGTLAGAAGARSLLLMQRGAASVIYQRGICSVFSAPWRPSLNPCLSLEPARVSPGLPGLATPWIHQQVRTKARGNEYQPSNLKRKHKHGWIKRIREASGIRVILRRMLKGRKSLSH
ncbi:large ribosomal subunit protein bL34m [Elgaria multicarinata webbii]|uniref:large ribosomal subunit protein bL34m n=1 Tax=Elgaria multicarinata webbii TaxID=159646 RepID=UPI002FCD485B